MKILTTMVFLFSAYWAAAQAAPQDTIQTQPDVQQIQIGQTFAQQINELLTVQQQAQAKMNEIVIVMREQAGLDTLYQFKGFTSSGQAIYVGPPKE